MFTTFSPLPSPMINNNMYQQEVPKHSLPPLSQIITSMPYQQLPPPQQAQQQHYQYQTSFHQPEAIKKEDFSPTIVPQNNETKSQSQSPSQEVEAPFSPKYTSKLVFEKCTCRNEGNHIPRPRNAFILFRQQHHQSVLDEGNVIRTNPDVSRELGKRWRDLSADEKEYWNKLAEEEKKRHAEKYPGYRYIPRRCGKKGSCAFCKNKQQKQAQQSNQNQQQQQAQAQANAAAHMRLQQLTPPTSTSNTPEEMSSSSEEHAIAQSFLSLRNQQPHPSFTPVYYPQQQRMAPVAYVQHQAPAAPAPYKYTSAPIIKKEAEERSPTSPSDKAKICSFANILN